MRRKKRRKRRRSKKRWVKRRRWVERRGWDANRRSRYTNSGGDAKGHEVPPPQYPLQAALYHHDKI